MGAQATGSTSVRAHERAVAALRAAGTGDASWAEASRLACDVVGADAAAFVVWRTKDGSVDLIEGHGHDEALLKDYNDHYYQHDVLVQYAKASNEWRVSDEAFPERQWGRHEFFGGFLKRHSVAQVIALSLQLNNEVAVALSFHRHSRRNTMATDFEVGNLRQFTEEAYNAFATREKIRHGVRSTLAASFTDEHSVCLLADSRAGVSLLSAASVVDALFCHSLLAASNGALRHRDSRVQNRLLGLLSNAVNGRAGRVTVRGGPTFAFRIEAQPAPAATKLANAEALALVRVIKVVGATAPDQDDLRSLFGLTGAEARVLAGLCRGLSVRECADELQCGEATVRTHVTNLLGKMNCTRQGALIRAAMMAI